MDYSKAVYSGISFPPRRDPKSGFFAIAVNEDLVKESIYTILSTPKGSLEIAPHFGSSIHSSLWENITPTSQSILCQQIKEDIESQEPRLVINSVAAYSHENTRIVVISGIVKLTGSPFTYEYTRAA